MSDGSSKPALGFSVERLNAFTDGVLAIVITILVLGIDIPEDHRYSDHPAGVSGTDAPFMANIREKMIACTSQPIEQTPTARQVLW